MIRVNDLAKGVMFYNSHVKNPNVDDFGVLTIIDYKFKTGKRCLNPDQGGMFDRVPMIYEDTSEIIITYKNSNGKEMKTSYWLDSFKEDNDLILLDKDNAEHEFAQKLTESNFKDAVERLHYNIQSKGYYFTSIIDDVFFAAKYSEKPEIKKLANKILDIYKDITHFNNF